jgi:sec-independent protein translocase protein TatA
VILNDILQPTHLLLILVVALLVLGPKRLPEATRSIGRGIHDFRSAITGASHGDPVATEAPARDSGDRPV